MKWTIFFLVWSGVALAANQDKGAQNNDDAEQVASNATDVQAPSSNSTADIGNGNGANNDDDNNGNGNNDNDNENQNANLIDEINGQNCINVAALQNVELVSPPPTLIAHTTTMHTRVSPCTYVPRLTSPW